MTLDQLIAIADGAYPDGFVGMYHQEPDEQHGDTLAKFIAIELKDTFDSDLDDDIQIQEATRALETAVRELNGVVSALYSAYEALEENTNV